MSKVKLTITASCCRSEYHHSGEVFIVEDLCPPMCHELWHSIYPNVMVLLNHGDLDCGELRQKHFEMNCPDNGRVTVSGEVIE